MVDLIETQRNQVPVMVRCDCKKRIDNGQQVPKKSEDQPLVLMTPGIDSDYMTGTCKNCKKQHVERLTPKQKKAKNAKVKKAAA